MAAFDYVALDDEGRTRNGVIAASDERAARRDLRRRNLAPVRLTPQAGAAVPAASPGAAPKAAGRLSLGSPRMDSKALMLVTRQMATLIAVAPLEEALRTIAQQNEKPAVRTALGAVHAAVLEGHRLSDAMGRQPRSFPPLYRAMVSAGESSGSLPAILERLADLLERDQEMRGKIVTALVYPIMLALTAVLVIMALMTFVVPKVVDQFQSMGQTLPMLTRVVIAASDGLRQWGWLGLIALGAGVVLGSQALRQGPVRLAFDGAMLRVPVIGRLIRDLHAAQLARTLSTMGASGLPVMEGLIITARTVHNRVLRQAVEGMATAIREGGSLSAAMRRAEVFPPILVYMAASGENSGRLDVMLSRAADYLEREFNTFTSVALSLLEPAIIIVMGGIVAVIVLAIMLPILQINTLALG